MCIRDRPDNAQELWEAAEEAEEGLLAGVNFAVCGLGDENYDQFCQSAIEWDEMFEKLGGTRAVERMDCDTDYEDTAPEWITKALDAMSKVEPAPAPQPEAGSGKELIVFFGSQTGNAEELA